MEFIVQLFRALANHTRIRVLRLLAVLGEMTVSQLAEAVALESSLVSGHLRVLAAAGLVWRRRSGRAVAYRLAERAGNPVTAAALEVLQQVFRAIRATDPKRIALADQTGSPTSSDAALFACFTAFTHPRRLQILRHLAHHGAASPAELATCLSMSMCACLRHLAKLERRGVLRRRTRRRRTRCSLAQGSGAVHRTLVTAVREYLVRRKR